MTYRNVATVIWTDDNILNMSPEQKLIFLYLHTSPYTSACGIFKLHPKTMGFQIGLTTSPLESSLRGLCAAFPDFVAVDWDTMEVGLLQYPRQLLITANNRALAIVAKDIQQIESQYLLRELVKRNSAGLSAPYVAQLRRLQMQAINNKNVNTLLDGDVALAFDNQQTNCEKEIKQNKQTKESTPAQLEDSYEPVNTWLPTTENEGQFHVQTIALETIPNVECEVPRPEARPTSKISELQKNINAHSEAAEHFLRLLQTKGHSLNGAEKYAAAYFLNEQRKTRWVSLLIPTDAGAEHRWLGEHGPGIIQWAQRQPQFERNNGIQPTAPAAPVQIRREI